MLVLDDIMKDYLINNDNIWNNYTKKIINYYVLNNRNDPLDTKCYYKLHCIDKNGIVHIVNFNQNTLYNISDVIHDNIYNTIYKFLADKDKKSPVTKLVKKLLDTALDNVSFVNIVLEAIEKIESEYPEEKE